MNRKTVAIRHLLLAILLLLALSETSNAQCVGLPTPSALGSNKTPVGLCSPVSATLSYNVTFISPVPAGTLELVYSWGDGSPNEVIPLVAGGTTYTANRPHNFPVNSDCEFFVIMYIRYNGVICATTRQLQKVASWRTEDFNGGNPQLISPVTGTTEHQVCAGVDVDVIFSDNTTFNCQSDYVHLPPDPVETPNQETRWSQIVYNTPIAGSIIPNVFVNGVQVTGAGGATVIANLQDSRGVLTMASPVIINDPRRRPSLRITAAGGFGAGFPQVGDQFELTLRYWNLCNPYDDPNVLGPPADLVNGDFPPIERTATIRIISSPPVPTGSTSSVCSGTTPAAFSVTGVPANNIVNWYRDVAGVPGTLITSGTSTTLPVTSHPNWVSNTTAGTYDVWASYRPNIVGAINCESPKVLVRRIIRNATPVPDPSAVSIPFDVNAAISAEICNPASFTIAMPAAASETFGGATQYTYTGSSGVTFAPTSGNNTTVSINIASFGAALFVDRTITINRRYTTSPQCTRSRTFTLRIYRPTVPGTLSSSPDICETSPISPISISGTVGNVLEWQVSFNGGAFVADPTLGTTITASPGLVPAGTYRFRALVDNGACSPSQLTNEEEVIVFANPGSAADAGPNQDICGSVFSNPFTASNPAPGTGTWSITTKPAASAATTANFSNVNSPNAVFTSDAPGTYILRWTVSNGLCLSFDEIQVDYGANPTDPNAGPDQQICGTSSTLAGNTLLIGNGSWSVVSGPGACVGAGCQITIANPTVTNSSVSLNGPGFVYGAYTLRWSAVSGGVACFLETDDVVITFDEPATATAANVGPVCIDQSVLAPIALSGTFGGGATAGRWEVVLGTGTITSGLNQLANPVSDSYQPTIDDYNAGTALKAKLVALPPGTSVCPAEEHEITISIDRKPVADAGLDIPNICGNSIQLNAENPPPFSATGLWSTATPGVIFDNAADAQTFVRNLPVAPSVTQVTWTLTSASGICVSDPVTIDLTRVSLPSVTNLDLTECEASPAGAPVVANIILNTYENSLTTLPAVNRTITWYKNSVPPLGTLIIDPSATITNVVSGQLYVARVRDNSTNCTNDALVSFTVRPLPEANAATIALCEDALGSNTTPNVDLTGVSFTASVTTATNVTISWHNSPLDATNNVNPIVAPFNVFGSRLVYARVAYSDVAPFCVNIAEVNLVVNPLPSVTSILGRSTVCLGDPSIPVSSLPVDIYQVPFTPGARYYWTIPDNPLTEYAVYGGGTTSDFFVLMQFPNDFDGTLRLTIELNGCSGSEITKDITVNPLPAKPIIAGDVVVCEKDDGIAYTVTNTNFPTSTYNWEIRKRSDGSLGGAFVTGGQGTDNLLTRFESEKIRLSVRESNAICISDTTEYWVTVNQRPILLDTDVTICSDASTGVTLTADPLSPVPIDKFNITNVDVTVGLNAKVGPALGNNLLATALLGDTYENLQGVPLPATYTVVPISVGFAGKECSGTQQFISVSVNPEPQLDPNLGESLCSEEKTQVTLKTDIGSFSADRFVIKSITSGGLTTINPTPPINTDLLANAIFDDQWINNTTARVDVIYDISPKNSITGCEGNPPLPVLIPVYPKPQITPVAAKTICGDQSAAVPINVSIATASVTWNIVTVTGGIQGANSGFSGTVPTSIADNLINNTTAPGLVQYQIIAKNPVALLECISNPLIVDVTVNPAPEAIDIDDEACSDIAGGPLQTTVTLSTLESTINTSGSVTYSWFSDAGLTVPIAGPSHAFVNGVDVFVRVQETLTSCTSEAVVNYTVNPQVSIGVTAAVRNGFSLFCNNDGTGQITVNALTGTPAFGYQIDGGAIQNSGASFNFSFQTAGLHTIQVTDVKGCTASTSITLTEPPVLVSSLAETAAIKCFLGRDGEITTSVIGGTGTYTNFLLLQTNGSNGSGVFGGLGVGAYNVRVTDSNGCTDDSNVINLAEPTQVQVASAIVTDANGFALSCKDAVDGRINVSANGGFTGTTYTYSLVRSGDPTSPFQTINAGTASEQFTTLPFGTYSVQATDVNGCVSLPAIAVIVNPPPFNAGFVGINQGVCEGDDPTQINELVPAFGGIGNYQYQWQQSLTGSNNDADWFDLPAGLGGTASEFDPAVLGTTTFFRRLVTSGSCNTGGKDVTVEVTVNPLPIVTFDAPTEVCEGESFFIQLNLLQGTAPIEYDYNDGSTTFSNLVGIQNTVIPISNFTQATTYTLQRVKDLNGCTAVLIPPPVTVNIIKINPDFNVISSAEQCPGNVFEFEWNVESNVKYTWIWSDNTQDVINPGDRTNGVNTIPHIFPGGSTANSSIYPVRLQAENTLCLPRFTTKPITVYPSLALNLLPGDDELCSGEIFRIRDQSLGVGTSNWYYREKGTTDQLEPKAGPIPVASWTLTNTTVQNPIVYEVVYEASNVEGCTDSYTHDVIVYKSVTAGITVGTIPPFSGGSSLIPVTNSSSLIDEALFDYTWDFGDIKATPSTFTGANPGTVEYFSTGSRDIVLKVTNKAAMANGKSCVSTALQNILIPLPNLQAQFTATPLAGCFPIEVTVQNTSPGADTFVWELYNNGGLVATSNLNNPTFTIQNPGNYDIFLTASVESTGQVDFAELKGIEVFNRPIALFEFRPNPVYVPDTEIQTFNFSQGANLYEWDFGFGLPSGEFEPRLTPTVEGKYKIQLTALFDHGPKDLDGDGISDGNVICSDTTSQELVALDGGFIKLPNAFTPNVSGSTDNTGQPGNGTFNDVFLPITRGVEEFKMQIFDRWGTLIFETTEKDKGWDGYDKSGNLLPAGVYVFKLTMRLSNGQRTTKIGDVTLLR